MSVRSRWWCSDRLHRRFLVLWATGILLDLLAWSLWHLLVPEGALRGLFPGGDAVSGAGAWDLVSSILLYNVGLACGLVALANLFRVRGYPLGYLPVLFHWGMYGLFLGTNSFDVVRDRETVPSVSRLLSSVGFLEITAYTLVAAATADLYLYRQDRLLQWSAERVRSPSDVRLRRPELLALGLALVLVLVAAWRESAGILAAGWS